jgi:eukaryotic-like serine/threonine-protein kinase
MIGKTISHYKILDKLGEGGMGVVYRAHDTKLDRTVALKFLPSHLGTDDIEKQRFLHEARAASALDHNNICSIYSIEESDDGDLFIVMAYYEGMSLKQKIEQGPLPLKDVVYYAIQIASGLQKAHEKGIVHRDLKPANIFITNDNQVKIIDFGLAKATQRSMLTKAGTTLGTVPYMSPEQAQGGTVDHRTDIWSLGVVLYEMITGKLPFKSEYEMALVYSIINEEPEPVTGLRTGVPVSLENIIVKCLEKDPQDRYQHADEIIVDVRSVEKEISSEIRTKVPAPGKSEKTLPGLAVLPFMSIKSHPETEFLGFALADQIITALTYIKNILVRPSSAVRKYQNQTVDAPTAGKDLHVDFILTGYYLKEDDIVRLNVELVNTQTNDMVWRESVEVKYENAFKLQDIVSKKVIHGLKVQFSNAERGRIQTDIPGNPLAYEYYLRSISYQHTNDGDKLAIEMLRKTIVLDPGYAPAHAELGSRLRSFGTFALQGMEASKEAEASYLKALSLNSELLGALGGLANLYTDIGKTEEALDYARRMLNINPNHALAHFSLSYLFRYVGMLGESKKEAEEAFALDPHNAKFRSAGYTYFYLGNYEKAIEIFELDKESVMAIAWKGFALFLMGKKKEAMKLFDTAISLEPEGHFGLHFGAIKNAELGKVEKGLSLVRKLEETDPYDSELLYNIANTYAFLGDKEGCVRALKRTIEGGFINYHYMTNDPLLKPMMGEPEVKQLLELAKSKHESFKEKYIKN